MYPYDFVSYPPASALRRTAPVGHDVLQGRSGMIVCELEALSPLLVMDTTHRSEKGVGVGRFMQNEEGQYHIPGTSLKGMVRSIFEVLVPSCVPVNDRYKTGHLIPHPFTSCQDGNKLCPACRLFGFIGRGRGSTVYRGQVSLGEARLLGSATEAAQMQLVPLFQPHPEIDAIYKPDGEPAGRKFYFHHRHPNTATSENERDRGPQVVPLIGRDGEQLGATFKFAVTFKNLSEHELAGLVAALVLSDAAPFEGGTVQVRHKLGYGKPAGLGSVEIRITKVQLDTSGKARYQSFAQEPSVLEGDALTEWVGKTQAHFFDAPTDSVQELIRILRYPAPADVEYYYPVSY